MTPHSRAHRPPHPALHAAIAADSGTCANSCVAMQMTRHLRAAQTTGDAALNWRSLKAAAHGS